MSTPDDSIGRRRLALALREDEKLCRDMQRIFKHGELCRPRWVPIAVTLLIWCRELSGGYCREFVECVLQHVDILGEALAAWWPTVRNPNTPCWELYWRESPDWNADGRQHTTFSRGGGDDDGARDLLRLYNDNTHVISLGGPGFDFATVATDGARWLAPPGGATLRDPVMCAAFVRSLTLLAKFNFLAYGDNPNWDAIPHGTQLRELTRCLGDADGLHRGFLHFYIS